MVESAAGLSEAEAIAAVPGIDAVMIGANDLATDLGRPGALEHPDVQAAFARIARATRSAGKVFGVIGLPEALLDSHGVSLGARLILAANDINLLLDGASALSTRLRPLVSAPPDPSP
jgi:2-keto-3-deoxy-L-rhamnonate aldolase RhmA